MEPTQSQELSSTSEKSTTIKIDIAFPTRLVPVPKGGSVRVTIPSSSLNLSWLNLFKLMDSQELYNFFRFRHHSYVVRDHRPKRSEWRLTDPIIKYHSSFKRRMKVFKAAVVLKRRNYHTNTSNGLLMVANSSAAAQPTHAMPARSVSSSCTTNSSGSTDRIPGGVIAARLQAPIQAIRASGPAIQAMQAPIAVIHSMQAPAQAIGSPIPAFQVPIPAFQSAFGANQGIAAPFPENQSIRAPIPAFQATFAAKQGIRAPFPTFHAPFPENQSIQAPIPAFQATFATNQGIRAPFPNNRRIPARNIIDVTALAAREGGIDISIPYFQARQAPRPTIMQAPVQTIRAPIPDFQARQAPVIMQAPVQTIRAPIQNFQARQAPPPVIMHAPVQTIRAPISAIQARQAPISTAMPAPIQTPTVAPSSGVNRNAAFLLRYVRESGGR